MMKHVRKKKRKKEMNLQTNLKKTVITKIRRKHMRRKSLNKMKETSRRQDIAVRIIRDRYGRKRRKLQKNMMKPSATIEGSKPTNREQAVIKANGKPGLTWGKSKNNLDSRLRRHRGSLS